MSWPSQVCADADALDALIARDIAVEELRVQLSFEQSFTSALVNLRTRPLAGVDEKSFEQTTGISLSSLATVRGLVDEAVVSAGVTQSANLVEEGKAAQALADVTEIRRRVDAGQVARDEVDQYFERADDTVEALGQVLLSSVDAYVTTIETDSLAAGLEAWTDYLAVVHFGIDEMSGLVAFLPPDARWQSATSRFDFAAALSGFDRSIAALDASMPDALRTDWAQLRQSTDLTDLQVRRADLPVDDGPRPPG